MLILLAAMAVLLPLLAALQYYWLGQVSEGASERLQSSLRASANRFRLDFNREFIRAYLNFQMDSLTPPQDIEKYHADRFEHWSRTAPHPRLISDVFVVTYDEKGGARLSHLNAKTKRLESTEWSGEFANLRDRFERHSGGELLTRGEVSAQDSLEPFAEDIPALIVPFPLVSTQNSSPQLPPGFAIVKLDLNYIQREFIPSLVQHQLFDDSPIDCNVAVTSVRHPDRVIYSSSSSMVDFSSSDVSTRIFGLAPAELEDFVKNETASPVEKDQPAPRQLRLINLRVPKGRTASSSVDDGHWQLSLIHI